MGSQQMLSGPAVSGPVVPGGGLQDGLGVTSEVHWGSLWLAPIKHRLFRAPALFYVLIWFTMFYYVLVSFTMFYYVLVCCVGRPTEPCPCGRTLPCPCAPPPACVPDCVQHRAPQPGTLSALAQDQTGCAKNTWLIAYTVYLDGSS